MSQSDLARENYGHFCYARDHGHLDFIQKAERCDAYFKGQQWDPLTVQRLERLGKPIITINKILSTCAAIFGEQLQNRADVSFRPGEGGNPDTASTLDKLWIQFTYANNLDWLESEMAADGFIRSRGFIDLRIEFDDQMRGETRATLLNSKNVVIDPDASSYDPDGWNEVFTTKWLTELDIESTYGDAPARELSGRPGTSFVHPYDQLDWMPDTFGGSYAEPWGVEETEDVKRRRLYRVIERQFVEIRNVEWFVNIETGDLRIIPETWDRERIAFAMDKFGLGVVRRPARKIRWRTSVDDLLLHDAVSPYKHFTPVPFFPYFRHGTTIGIVENLISPQDLLNKSVSQELHIVNTTANSGWKVENGSLVNMTIEELEDRSGEDGLILVTQGGINSVDKIQPNQVPSGIDRLSFKADESLKEVSMVSDSMRGFDRADVAAKAIQAKQARGSVSMAKPFDNLAFTRRILARNALDLWQTFYDEERTIFITGRNLTDEPEELQINTVNAAGDVVNDLTIGEYAVVVSTVPARADHEQTQFQEALELRQLGIALPDDVLVEYSHLTRKTEIARRIKDASGAGEPSQAALQLQQLEIQLKQLEAAEKEANVQVKQSNAQLNAARANKENAQQAQGGQDQAAMVEAAMKREEMLSRLAADRERMYADIRMKREELQATIQLKREELQAKLELERAKVAGQLDVASRKQEQAEAMAGHQAGMAEADQAFQHEHETKRLEHQTKMDEQAAKDKATAAKSQHKTKG